MMAIINLYNFNYNHWFNNWIAFINISHNNTILVEKAK